MDTFISGNKNSDQYGSKVSFQNSSSGIKTEGVSHSKIALEVDEELERILSSQKTRIKVVGCGGGGNNTINRISEVGVHGIETIGVNTDAQDLLYTRADKKILIGRELTHGLGAGSNPKVGEQAARENESDLRKALEGADMVFITCGLGGGTGTGAAPFIAELARKGGMLSVGVVTLPFTMEGSHRFENAMIGLEKLEQSINTLIVIPNEKLLELAPHLPLQTAFKVADEILTNAVKGIAELVTKAGLVNLDFADIKTIMSEGGVALIGMGESDSEQDRAKESVQKALNNPLIDVDISTATAALINISGGEDLTLDESRQIVEAVAERLSPNAKIIWGAQIYKDLEKTIRTMLIITGVKSEQIFGEGNKYMVKKKQAMETELGIEFMN
ncbi:cell division protein FtsZ [Candidatus Woesearchaeota archaeon]|nr:cell division protein FtsZ [Candidatus Woesearchaeota archaeon]